MKADPVPYAFRAGYTCDTEGNVYDPEGALVQTYSKGKHRIAFYLPRRYRKPDLVYGSVPVHRFIAYLKFGSIMFEPGIEVRHDDDNSFNNSWDNILIGTPRDNRLDAYRNGRQFGFKAGSDNFSGKLTPKQVKLMRALAKKGYTYDKLGMIFGVSRQTAWRVVTYRSHL